MKNINFKYLLVLALFTFVVTSCEDDDTLPVDFEDLNTSGGAFATEAGTNGETNINRNNPSGSTFQKTYVIHSPRRVQTLTQ